MKQDKILNSKDKKLLFKSMREQWGTDTDKLKDIVFIQKSSGRIFITNKETAEIEMDLDIRKYSVGNYFGKEEKDGFRASIEGSQLLGPLSSHNIVDIDEEGLKAWIRGEDITVGDDVKGLSLVRCDERFVGCGRVSDGSLKNHIPKSRRLKNI